MVHGYGRARKYVLLAVFSAALGVLITRPASAEPSTPAVPDAGSRPQVAGSLQLPNGTAPGGTATFPTGTVPAVAQPGPLGQEILSQSAAVETLSQQLLKLESDLDEAKKAAAAAQAAWSAASDELSVLRDKAGHEAGEAYKAATALGPL